MTTAQMANDLFGKKKTLLMQRYDAAVKIGSAGNIEWREVNYGYMLKKLIYLLFYFYIQWEEILIRLTKSTGNADGEPVAENGLSEEQKVVLKRCRTLSRGTPTNPKRIKFEKFQDEDEEEANLRKKKLHLQCAILEEELR